MIQQSSTLIIEASDFTQDGNLRAETYQALKTAAIVIDGTDVIKNSVTGLITQKEPQRRQRAPRTSSTPGQTETPPQSQAGAGESTPSPSSSSRTPGSPEAPQRQAQDPAAGQSEE